MPLIISKNTLVGNRIGISAPADADALIDGNTFRENDIGIEVRDSAQLIDQLGLQAETPPAALISLLRSVSPGASQASVEQTAAKVGLVAWLKLGVDVASLAVSVLKLFAAGQVEAGIAVLSAE